MEEKTETRILAEKIQAVTGESLFMINQYAMEFVSIGVCADRKAALEYMVSIL